MEIGFHARIPTYSGGLGVLAGDTVVSAADLRVPMVAVTLVHRKGYFIQEIDGEGRQQEKPASWNPEEYLELLSPIVCVQIERRNVFVRAWRYLIKGVTGATVPVFLLDTNIPENSEEDRGLTDHLYGGEQRYRLSQEIVLGIGGIRMLRALGYRDLERFHMNEGHAALLTLELLHERTVARVDTKPTPQDVDAIRHQCVFTTHTPVPAGHDQFPLDLVEHVLGPSAALGVIPSAIRHDHLNMTYLALSLSRYTNAVARRHGEVSRQMFSEYQVDSITNGVHAATWTSDSFCGLFDRRIPLWRQDNFNLRQALWLSNDEIWDAHMAAKRELVEHIKRTTTIELNADVFTLGFARRAAAYKRADLLVSNVDWLTSMADKHGPMQVIYAGKAHPRDGGGKELIHRVHEAGNKLGDKIKLVYVPNYEMNLGRLITSGVDVWVNTPQRPLEASGTSGMKSALNGVPSLSILDGWWVEGCIENVTGWAIGGGGDNGDWQNGSNDNENEKDAHALYEKLEHAVLPMYHQDREAFINIMRHAIAVNGSYFNTQRMVLEYVNRAYYA
jgi:glycogen phosphorylase